MNDEQTSLSWLMPIAVWATFFLYGAVAAPVPGVNEPHYLCKSKHFWQPTWCARDFFLVSPNAHTVFYATVGSLTRVFTLDQSAWIGRLIASALLAWGWTHCFSRIMFTPWAPLWAAWIYLAIAACGNFSGEWLVGGLEGKVFSYAFLMLAFGDVLRDRNRRAAIWAGIGVSFHPVVGVWALLAHAASHFTQRFLSLRRERRMAIKYDLREGRETSVIVPPTIGHLVRREIQSLDPLACLFLFAFSLPGLIPVVRLLTETVPADTRYAATYIQVYFRLAHHLDPMQFPRRAYVGYTLLLGIWIASLFWGGRVNPKRAIDRVVFCSIIFALVGIGVGYGPRPPALMPYFAQRMNLLKFYPFRLADLLIPVAVAVSLISVLERTLLNRPRKASWQFSLSQGLMLIVLISALWRVHLTRDSNRYVLEDRADWLDICSWIDNHLPEDALVQSPTNGWAFKWFARRAEYVAYKDCPQDAVGIVEWNRRLNFLKKWYEDKYADQLYSATELREFRQQTGLTHLLSDRLGPLELEPVYRNKTFQVYDLTTLDQ